MAGQDQLLLQFPAPAVLDVFQVAILGGAVNLVSRDGMAQMRQMHAYLVHAACFRNAPDQGQRAAGRFQGALYTECRDAFLSGGMYCLFYPDAAFPYFPLPQDGGRADRFLPFWPSPDDGQVFLVHQPPLDGAPQLAGGASVFRNQGQAAGFPVQPVDKGKGGSVDQFVTQQLLHAFQQVGFPLPVGRMDDQRGSLAHHNPVFRLRRHIKMRETGNRLVGDGNPHGRRD